LRRRRHFEARKAPHPVAAITAEARTHRVVEDVFDRLLPVVVVPNEPGNEALFKEVPFALPARVEPLRVETTKPVHPRRQVFARCLHQEMEVRTHEAPGVQLPFEHGRDPPEEEAESLPVGVVEKDVDPACAPVGDVADAPELE
jgi:hypothetical protein